MAEPSASLESHCFFAVRNVIKEMASAGVFRLRGTDSTDRVRPEAVTSQLGRGDDGVIPMPGFLVTYLGHSRALNAGENDSDIGKVDILVQFLDKSVNEDAPGANSYFTWMEAVRRWLLDGPLESPDETLGFVYHTHVSQQAPPEEYKWAVHDKVKLSLLVSCFTKTTRTIDKAQA